jgi:pimeloyl-ACP methyl ester carboxylesterase
VEIIETDLLTIAFESGGNPTAPLVLLLHGWPDDATTWHGLTPHLEQQGFRWVAPWLRGCGPTSFKDSATFRDGSAEALAQDALDLMEKLGTERFSVIGHDWGARTAYTLAALVPERLDSIAALSLAYSPRSSFPVPPFKQSRAWWYQWFMSVDSGADAIKEDPIGFARLQWETWSPPGWFSEEEFTRVAHSFENNDWLPITFNSYRARWRKEPRDPRYDDLRQQVAAVEKINVKTLMIQGLADGTVLPESTEDKENDFTSSYRRIALPGVGHFPTREAPDALAAAIIEHLS